MPEHLGGALRRRVQPPHANRGSSIVHLIGICCCSLKDQMYRGIAWDAAESHCKGAGETLLRLQKLNQSLTGKRKFACARACNHCPCRRLNGTHRTACWKHELSKSVCVLGVSLVTATTPHPRLYNSNFLYRASLESPRSRFSLEQPLSKRQTEGMMLRSRVKSNQQHEATKPRNSPCFCTLPQVSSQGTLPVFSLAVRTLTFWVSCYFDIREARA